MSRRTLPPAKPMEAGATLQYVVGEIYRLIQENFGERDADIFRLHDAGERTSQLATSFGLTTSHVRQIVSSIQKFVSECFAGKRLRLLPLVQKLQSSSEQIDVVLAAGGFEINKTQLAALTEREELIPEPQLFKTELDILNLNARSRNALIHHKITTVEDLCNLTYHDLYVMRGIGDNSIKHIEQALQSQGLCIKEWDALQSPFSSVNFSLNSHSR